MTDKLRNELSLQHLFSYGFGSIIGVGWITVMGVWLGLAGPVGASLAFLFCSVLILVIARCYGELAVEFPVTGAEVTYVHETFGLVPAFVVGWLMALAYVGIVIFEFVSVGWVLEALFPSLRENVVYTIAGTEVSLGGLLAGLIVTLLVTWFNIRGARNSGTFQQYVTFSLIAVSVGFILLAFHNGDVANLKPYFGPGNESVAWAGFFAVFVTVPFWFGGFNVIPQGMSERSREAPARAIRVVMTIAVLSAALFYALVILAAGIAAPQGDLLAADLPVKAAVVAATGSEWGGRLVLIAGLLGLVSTWNAFLYGGSRVIFALGRARIVWPVFGRLSGKYQTPARALLLIGLLGVGGGIFGRSAIMPVVDTGAIVFSMAYFSVCLALLRRRWQSCGTSGQYRRLLLPFTGAAASMLIVVTAVYFAFENSDRAVPTELLVLGAWLGIGVLGFVLERLGKKPLTAEARRSRLLTEAASDSRR